MRLRDYIVEQSKKLKLEVDPRFVESGLLLRYGGTSNLSAREFNKEIRLVAEICKTSDGVASLERSALSWGL